jgi:rhodanese-related sulfurtransferase
MKVEIRTSGSRLARIGRILRSDFGAIVATIVQNERLSAVFFDAARFAGRAAWRNKTPWRAPARYAINRRYGARAGRRMMKKGYRELLDEANAEIEAVSPDEAAALLDDDETVFVDLRDPREIERDGNIPGARHCTRGMLEFWIDPESPYHKPWFASGKSFVFFCAGGWRSALATKTAQDMGLTPVKHILGGFTAWKAAGLPVEPAKKK